MEPRLNSRYKAAQPISREEAQRRATAEMERRVTPEYQKWAEFVREIADFIDGALAQEDGLTQRVLAERMGVQESTLSRLLSGDHNPTLKTLACLSVALGQDVVLIPSFSTYKTSQMEPTDFGYAIRHLRQGRKVARAGWNGKGMFLFLLPAGTIPKAAIHDPKLKEILENNGSDRFEALGSIRMKTADDKILTGWLASQTDMLAEDWEVVQ